jgi:branched-chain amino acid transport system permease protein
MLGRLTEVIRELNAAGMTFLIVEHNIPLVLELCDPIVVFSRGAPIAEGPPGIIREDPAVMDAYLGEDFRLEPVQSGGPGGSGGASTGEGVR